MAIAPELVDRFLREFSRLRTSPGKFGLAVSGGPDSMALLALADAACDPEEFAVATVDHGLRREAADECALVAEACAARGLACTVLSADVAQGNLQEQARIARYAALGDWAGREGVTSIATAHHADDQAETVLMRLNRGSGLAGLSGIRARTTVDGCQAEIVRPLLSFRRSELRAIVEAQGLPFVEDPSNANEQFERVRIRRALARADWLDPRAIARSAAHVADAEQALVSLAELHWHRAAVVEREMVTVPRTELLDTNARLVARGIEHLGGSIAQGEAIEFLKGLSKRGNIAGVLVESRKDCFLCRREPARRTS